jgi:predicted membrane channel-forming protein YqfA (hemolysin III family)
MITHEQAEQRVKLGFFIHLGIFVAVTGGLVAMNLIRRPEQLWSAWVVLGWGLGICLHAFGVFANAHSRERMVQRTMQRVNQRLARHHSHATR